MVAVSGAIPGFNSATQIAEKVIWVHVGSTVWQSSKIDSITGCSHYLPFLLLRIGTLANLNRHREPPLEINNIRCELDCMLPLEINNIRSELDCMLARVPSE